MIGFEFSKFYIPIFGLHEPWGILCNNTSLSTIKNSRFYNISVVFWVSDDAESITNTYVVINKL